MRPTIRLSAALALLGCASAQADEPAVRLAPHRVVYDLSLASSRGSRTIESARGRIAFEFTGNACEGYALNFRQVTVLQSAETGAKMSDLRTVNFESGDGHSFRFRNDTRMGEADAGQVVDGDAERGPGGSVAVRLKRPKTERVTPDGSAVFPNAQMRDVIAAAREGRSTFSEKVFDGSDDGHKVYETLAVIGREIAPGATDGLEAPARQDGLAKLRRWPVTMSYFMPGKADGTPIYVLGFDLYENGVSRALRLDYGDFALKGEMTQLELLPDKGCGR